MPSRSPTTTRGRARRHAGASRGRGARPATRRLEGPPVASRRLDPRPRGSTPRWSCPQPPGRETRAGRSASSPTARAWTECPTSRRAPSGDTTPTRTPHARRSRPGPSATDRRGQGLRSRRGSWVGADPGGGGGGGSGTRGAYPVIRPSTPHVSGPRGARARPPNVEAHRSPPHVEWMWNGGMP